MSTMRGTIQRASRLCPCRRCPVPIQPGERHVLLEGNWAFNSGLQTHQHLECFEEASRERRELTQAVREALLATGAAA